MTAYEPPPASGAWRPGDPPGHRQFATFPDGLKLEAGGRLESVTVAYETWGELNADRSNAVLVLHALTGDSHAAGPVDPITGEGLYYAIRSADLLTRLGSTPARRPAR